MRILLKFLWALLLAYFCAGIFLVLQSFLTSSEPGWIVFLAPVMVFTEPLEMVVRAPLVAIVWVLAFYLLVTLVFDRHKSVQRGTPLLVQHILRRLLVVLPLAYVCAGIVMFLYLSTRAQGPDTIQYLLFGPWIILIGPAQAIFQNPLIGMALAIPWLLLFYLALSFVWRVPSIKTDIHVS